MKEKNKNKGKLTFVNWFRLYKASLKCYPKNNVRLIYYERQKKYDISIFFSNKAIETSLLAKIII